MDSVGARVICLIGVDGTGKTSHALEIANNLRRSGQRCNYVWFGSPYILSLPFMIICRFLKLTIIHPLQNGEKHSDHQYYKNKVIAMFWPWIVFLDLATLVLMRVYLPLLAGFSVVCDRFVHDALVETMVDTRDDKLFLKLIGRITLALKPNSAVVYLLDIDHVNALKRKSDIPNSEYLSHRIGNYRRMSKYLNIPAIDSRQPYKVVQNQLTLESHARYS